LLPKHCGFLLGLCHRSSETAPNALAVGLAACWKRVLASSRIDGANKIKHLLNVSVAATEVEIGSMISRTPGIKSGTPHIAGTGVTVRTIVRWYKLGMSAEEIAAEYPHLSLAQVYGALAYYHANRVDMDAHMAAEEAESDRIEQEHLRLQKSGT
jgi:uncharacterized protein (DUF433 family)